MFGSLELQQRIRWSAIEKQQILDQAVRVRKLNRHLKPMELLRQSQKILPAERQRRITQFFPSLQWFATAVDNIDRYGTASPHVQSPIIPPGSLSNHRSIVEVDSATLTAHEISAGTVVGSGGLVDILLGTIARLERKIDGLAGELHHIRTRMDRGYFLTPATQPPPPEYRIDPGQTAPTLPTPALPTPAPITPPVPSNSVSALSLSVPPTARPPVVAPSVTRKARVVVLSVRSGHVKGGIKQGVASHIASLDCWDTPRRALSFDQHDYIITTKWTSPEWRAAARTASYAGKVHHASGNAREISHFITTLPAVVD